MPENSLNQQGDHDSNDQSKILLSIKDLEFGATGAPVCQPVSFDLHSGGIIWIQGPSGSGKTTLLKTIARLLSPVAGGMVFNGAQYTEIHPIDWRRLLVYVPQKPIQFRETVYESFKRPFSFKVRRSDDFDDEFMEEMLEAFLLPDSALSQWVHELSVGQMARVSLIRAILCNPMALLIDEISAALDEKSAKAVGQWLSRRLLDNGRCIVAVSHDEKLIEELPGQELNLEPVI